eukprot:3930354-Prymnesium_polylepis.1
MSPDPWGVTGGHRGVTRGSRGRHRPGTGHQPSMLCSCIFVAWGMLGTGSPMDMRDAGPGARCAYISYIVYMSNSYKIRHL